MSFDKLLETPFLTSSIALMNYKNTALSSARHPNTSWAITRIKLTKTPETTPLTFHPVYHFSCLSLRCQMEIWPCQEGRLPPLICWRVHGRPERIPSLLSHSRFSRPRWEPATGRWSPGTNPICDPSLPSAAVTKESTPENKGHLSAHIPHCSYLSPDVSHLTALCGNLDFLLSFLRYFQQAKLKTWGPRLCKPLLGFVLTYT